ncbi:MAG: response regulator [Chitinophagaceae bacterium]|jgi:CheY-like chemotaxis protein|nr:response regulator [Chitinophagaceae bacterium]
MIKSVFIVDDDPISIKICELVMNKAAFTKSIFSFTNGKEAIDYFSEYFERVKHNEKVSEAPELILLDLNMPIMNGWEFMENFMRKYASRLTSTAIAILSSSVDPHDFMKSQQYDVIIDFINKPLSIDLINELKQHKALNKYFVY